MVIDVDIHTTYINTSGEVIIILDELWLYSYGYTATASKHRYQLTIIIVVMCNSNL